ncbi:hypothetical protein FWH58_01455 [Candidatus Saccharibacteria bacterium]|nr:hypothetical protein [Candidatus Saccharibacteria bacterium]
MLVSKDIIAYQTKTNKVTGSSYKEIAHDVRLAYKKIANLTKRDAYIRSAYFKKDKIFLKLFWVHLHQQPMYSQKRRLQFFNCAIDLLRHSTNSPETLPNPNGRNELVHRFAGVTSAGERFYVQVKQELRSGKKYFMSVFPDTK